jgi:hypothetical protein
MVQAAGLRNNQFGFDITGTPNIPLLVEASTNLVDGAWSALQTGTLANGVLHITDPAWQDFSRRFYRVRSQ